MNKLTYKNNWEADQYFVNGEQIRELFLVEYNGEKYAVDKARVSIPYNDMGHTYYGVSDHFYITVDVMGTLQKIDLNRIVNKSDINAVVYEVVK